MEVGRKEEKSSDPSGLERGLWPAAIALSAVFGRLGLWSDEPALKAGTQPSDSGAGTGMCLEEPMDASLYGYKPRRHIIIRKHRSILLETVFTTTLEPSE